MNRLVPCPVCARHVRVGDVACPFCASALPERRDDVARGPLRSIVAPATSRAAILFLGAVAASGCGESKGPAESPSSGTKAEPTFNPIPPYGAPPPPPPDPTSSTAAQDAGAAPTGGGATQPQGQQQGTTQDSRQGASQDPKPAPSGTTIRSPVQAVPPYGVPPVPPPPPPPKPSGKR